MSDPHGWGAQNAAIKANRQAADRRQEEFLHGGAVVNRRAEENQVTPPVEQPPSADASSTAAPEFPYKAVVAYCALHDLWGCSFRQHETRRALYEAHSAASRHGSKWCPELQWTGWSAGYLSPGYIVVFRNRDGTMKWGGGRSKRAIAERLRDHLDPHAEELLVLSVKRGVLESNGIDLQVGWTKDMPGGM